MWYAIGSLICVVVIEFLFIIAQWDTILQLRREIREMSPVEPPDIFYE